MKGGAMNANLVKGGKVLCACLFLLAIVSIWASLATAKDRPPLPPALKNGKTVYLVHMLNDPDVFNRIRSKMKGWRRFQVTTDANTADLILVFTWHSKTLTDFSKNLRVFLKTGKITKPDVPGWEKAYEYPEYLAFFDKATADELLRVSCDRRGNARYTGDLLFGRLKSAIETAEKQEKNKKTVKKEKTVKKQK
jgi:hypothetical protein